MIHNDSSMGKILDGSYCTAHVHAPGNTVLFTVMLCTMGMKAPQCRFCIQEWGYSIVIPGRCVKQCKRFCCLQGLEEHLPACQNSVQSKPNETTKYETLNRHPEFSS